VAQHPPLGVGGSESQDAGTRHEPSANKVKKRSGRRLKPRVARELRYVFVVPPGVGHNGETPLYKELRHFPKDVAASLIEAGLAESRTTEAKRLRHANYLARENQEESLQSTRCMVGYVMSKNLIMPKPRRYPDYCCATCQSSPDRLCCYLQLYEKAGSREAVLFAYPKRGRESSWQELDFWL
jgi:hypothetical protein